MYHVLLDKCSEIQNDAKVIFCLCLTLASHANRSHALQKQTHLQQMPVRSAFRSVLNQRGHRHQSLPPLRRHRQEASESGCKKDRQEAADIHITPRLAERTAPVMSPEGPPSRCAQWTLGGQAATAASPLKKPMRLSITLAPRRAPEDGGFPRARWRGPRSHHHHN